MSIPKEIPEELLGNMVVRYDHGLGCPGYYDMPPFGEPGMHEKRLQATKTIMRQLYEEFYFHFKEKDNNG